MEDIEILRSIAGLIESGVMSIVGFALYFTERTRHDHTLAAYRRDLRKISKLSDGDDTEQS